jgi:hypothetical protein
MTFNPIGGIETMAKRKSSGVARPMDDDSQGPHAVRRKKKKSKAAKKRK